MKGQGQAGEIAPGVRRVVAPNPSPMTFRGTNSYIVGRGEVAVIDPGPADPVHLAALVAALGPGERVSHIFVTHAHKDHSALAPALSAATGAPVLAFGDAEAGRSALMADLARRDGAVGGEGADRSFHPDLPLADGQTVTGAGWSLRALHTPGHFGNHLCLAIGDLVFSGDHVMGWSTSVVAPPDGDMGAYMASLARLAAEAPARLLPGHGDPIDAPATRIAELIAHRLAREAAILEALASGPATAEALARRIYLDTPEALMAAASRNVFAHLIDFLQRNLARPDGQIAFHTPFRLG